MNVSSVARAAGVDRSFLYRHHDLRSQILAQPPKPVPSPDSIRTSQRSLLADAANLRAQNERLRRQNAALTDRLSEVLGAEVFRASGVGGDEADTALKERLSELEQQLLDCRRDLRDREDELAAARTANRDLMTTLNVYHGEVR